MAHFMHGVIIQRCDSWGGEEAMNIVNSQIRFDAVARAKALLG